MDMEEKTFCWSAARSMVDVGGAVERRYRSWVACFGLFYRGAQGLGSHPTATFGQAVKRRS